MRRMCTAIHKTAGENRETRSPLHQRRPCSAHQSIARSSASQSRTEQSDNWCIAVPEHRTWQINRSLHYLSNGVNEESDIFFRRPGQNAVTQPANPPGAFAAGQRFKISFQVSFQIIAISQQ